MKPLIFLLTLAMITSVMATGVFAQDAEKQTARKLFETGSFAKSADLFKKVVKRDPLDADSWSLLGMSYFKQNKYKDAIKPFEKAVELDPKNAAYHGSLSYLYLATDQEEKARRLAEETVTIDSRNKGSLYILGVLAYRAQSFDKAYAYATKALEVDPSYAPPYYLRSSALVGSFFALRGKVIPPGSREDLMPQAARDLEKYASLTAGSEPSEQLKEDVENLRFYANYYSKPENREIVVRDPNQPPDPTATGIKILTKPRPGYTDDASLEMFRVP